MGAPPPDPSPRPRFDPHIRVQLRLREEFLGLYRLLQKIGEGGMGEVWVADQTEPSRRKVALKVIKVGMDTAQVVTRFEAERQALALMDHPAIATVYDGGSTPEGRPYFVMEYVKGEPITDLLRPPPAHHRRPAGTVHAGLRGRPARAPEGDHPPRSEAVQRARRPSRTTTRCRRSSTSAWRKRRRST